MIRAEFFSKAGRLTGFSVSGHAGYADAGEDIVCAAVSSAVQLTANGITEVLGVKARVTAENDTVSLKMDSLPREDAETLFRYVIHGSFAVNRAHNFVKDEKWPHDVQMLNEFAEAGYERLSRK